MIWWNIIGCLTNFNLFHLLELTHLNRRVHIHFKWKINIIYFEFFKIKIVIK